MPPGVPGSLGDDAYAADGRVHPPEQRRRSSRRPGRRRAGSEAGAQDGARAPSCGRTGVTAPGEITNFVPVTDAMLRNPDPATG